MRKNFGAKPWLCPQPVFIIGTYDENGKPNAMNAAWGGIADADKIFICLAPHKTADNILLRKAFTVSMGTADTVVPCDYVGIVSANDEPQKMEKAGFTTAKSEFVDAPVICELPMTLECRLISYDRENDWLFGQVVNISAEEEILGEDGNIDLKKLRPILFDGIHGAYHTVGEKAGDAFSDGAQLQ